MKHFVVIGATSSIAEHCCRLWAKEPCFFHLIGRNQERLNRLKADLLTRSPQSQIEVREVSDFSHPQTIQQTIQACAAQTPIDLAFIAHGVLPDQTQAENDLELCKHSLEINALSPALWMEACSQLFQAQQFGKLVVIGSVAGDRGRKSNYIYGAPKGLITRYAQGLQHRFAHQNNIHVILVKPGPTETPMTAHLISKGGQRASVEKVAADIVQGVAKNRPTIYTPHIWALIMLIVRHLPRFIFHKLNI